VIDQILKAILGVIRTRKINLKHFQLIRLLMIMIIQINLKILFNHYLDYLNQDNQKKISLSN
jgi:hypothetical protein